MAPPVFCQPRSCSQTDLTTSNRERSRAADLRRCTEPRTRGGQWLRRLSGPPLWTTLKTYTRSVTWFLDKTDDPLTVPFQRFAKEVVGWKWLRHENILPFAGVTLNPPPFSMVSAWMENGNIMSFTKANSGQNPFLLVGIYGILHRASLTRCTAHGCNQRSTISAPARLRPWRPQRGEQPLPRLKARP